MMAKKQIFLLLSSGHPVHCPAQEQHVVMWCPVCRVQLPPDVVVFLLLWRRTQNLSGPILQNLFVMQCFHLRDVWPRRPALSRVTPPAPPAAYHYVKWFVLFLAPSHRIEPPLFGKDEGIFHQRGMLATWVQPQTSTHGGDNKEREKKCYLRVASRLNRG